jgi:hypothetical protein
MTRLVGRMDNFPPGHPHGVSHEEPGGEIYECDPCNYMLRKEEVKAHEASWQHKKAVKLFPADPNIHRAQCDKCGEPATHIDTDESVNFSLSYCDNCHM